MDYESVAIKLFAPAQINNIKYKMLHIFKALLKHKLWKYELHKDLDGSCLAMGEKVCLNLSFIIAARQMLNIDDPIDYSIAGGFLDKELKQGLTDYLISINVTAHI
ncbi:MULTISPECIES: hypothetical protein [Colwellia]|uniref:Uncharacterized protein n=1 Tax=Colwellia marinimaniae TaxID=1513592 RepID=A0ABQ0MWF1_9GAMM|nr:MULTISPECIES: hypothetical protein [Colwellia]GAW96685.1 hypothetical protein MTCD1_02305 [Colwellia marinimaniae]